jgi:hypothetical protein
MSGREGTDEIGNGGFRVRHAGIGNAALAIQGLKRSTRRITALPQGGKDGQEPAGCRADQSFPPGCCDMRCPGPTLFASI